MDPIFIVGCGRSGTTLLRLILNRHSSISIPEETWFFPQLYRELPDLLREENWRKSIAERVLQLNSIHFPNLAADSLENALLGTGKDDVAGIISLVNREFMTREGKRRWGDKTPGYVLHLRHIKKLFPKAKVIHIVRDGRDVVPSILKYWSVGPQTNSFLETAVYWRDHVTAGMKDGPKYFGDQYIEVRYEDLVTKPEDTVTKICGFIGEVFEPTMLSTGGEGKGYTPNWEWHNETRKEIDNRNVGKWKQTLSHYQIGLVELLGKRIFNRFEYAPVEAGHFLATCSISGYQFKRSLARTILSLKIAAHKHLYLKVRNRQ